MRRLRFSPRSSFARTLLLIVTLLFASLVTTYLVVLNFAILPSLQQFNKVLAYEVRMLMSWGSLSTPTRLPKRQVCVGRNTMNS